MITIDRVKKGGLLASRRHAACVWDPPPVLSSCICLHAGVHIYLSCSCLRVLCWLSGVAVRQLLLPVAVVLCLGVPPVLPPWCLETQPVRQFLPQRLQQLLGQGALPRLPATPSTQTRQEGPVPSTAHAQYTRCATHSLSTPRMTLMMAG